MTDSRTHGRSESSSACCKTLNTVTLGTHSTNITLAKPWRAVSLLYRNVFKIHTFYGMVQLLTVFILPVDAAVNRLPSLQKLAPLSRASFCILLQTQITSGRQNENSTSNITQVSLISDWNGKVPFQAFFTKERKSLI